jgi:hypothetical protein
VHEPLGGGRLGRLGVASVGGVGAGVGGLAGVAGGGVGGVGGVGARGGRAFGRLVFADAGAVVFAAGARPTPSMMHEEGGADVGVVGHA